MISMGKNIRSYIHEQNHVRETRVIRIQKHVHGHVQNHVILRSLPFRQAMFLVQHHLINLVHKVTIINRVMAPIYPLTCQQLETLRHFAVINRLHCHSRDTNWLLVYDRLGHILTHPIKMRNCQPIERNALQRVSKVLDSRSRQIDYNLKWVKCRHIDGKVMHVKTTS